MEQQVKKCIGQTKKKLGIAPNAKILVHAINTFEENTDTLAQLRQAQGVKFACKNGCAHCCNLRVEALPPEVFYIAAFIKSQPQSTQQQLIEKLQAHSEYASGRPFIEYNKPCVFLTQQGSCAIYSVRPHKCRANLSKQVERCITHRDPDEDEQLARVYHQLVIETVALYKKKNCVMHPAELGNSVLMALNDEQLESRWSKGEQVFALLPEQITL